MADAPDKQPQRRVLLNVDIPRGWLFGMLAALGVLIVVAIIAFSAVNRIDTCGTCHVVRAEVETYKETAHYRAGVGCQSCHTKPGAFNYLIRNLEGVNNLIAHVSGHYEQPVTAYVGADTCAQCHPNEELSRDIIAGGIRVNHKGLREAGYQCLTCHANISHPGTQLEVARVSQNKMSICARCHDGEQLSDDCDICHVGGVPANAPRVTMPVKVTPAQCGGCHGDSKLCVRCHNGLRMPHPPRWPSTHGTVVNDRGRSICVSCHLKDDPQFCIDCHGVVIPHPSGFRENHAGVAQRKAGACVKCHGENSCIRCHGLPMPHPAGFVGSHPGIASSNPGVCSRCHSSSFCTGCHGVSLPHSGSFIANHPSYAGASCAKCHGNGGQGGCYFGECHATGDLD
jgi:nitrate/TMAO reductase-like tetraheme cytochrome c subunit